MASPRSDQEIRDALADYKSGMTTLEVAKKYRASDSTVREWAKAAGIIRPSGSTRARRAVAAKRAKALDDLFTSGDSLTIVAERNDVPRATLARWSTAVNGDDIAYKGQWIRVGSILRGTARDVA